MAGVNDVKQVVTAAKNEQKFQRKTILFMDEIHRFNKLQQVSILSQETIFKRINLLFNFFKGHIFATR